MVTLNSSGYLYLGRYGNDSELACINYFLLLLPVNFSVETHPQLLAYRDAKLQINLFNVRLPDADLSCNTLSLHVLS